LKVQLSKKAGFTNEKARVASSLASSLLWTNLSQAPQNSCSSLTSLIASQNWLVELVLLQN